MKQIAIHWQIIIAIMLAISLAPFLKGVNPYISWIGVVFINALKMMIIPIVTTSLFAGLANIGNMGGLGKLGIKTIGLYAISSLMAIVTGLLFVNAIEPGSPELNLKLGEVAVKDASSNDIVDKLIGIVPENIFQTIAEGNMLAIIFLTLLVGVFVLKLPGVHKERLVKVNDSLHLLTMNITMFIIKFTPLGVFALIFNQFAESKDVLSDLEALGWYSSTVLSALGAHFFITLPLFVLIIGRINPIKFIIKMGSVLLTAFSTSSSNATLPFTLKTLTEEVGVSKRTAGFTLPLGATLNMDGTALYECVAVVFICQCLGMDLSFAQQATIVGTALLVSIGAAGIPMAGMFMMAIILESINLPAAYIAFILPVDRLLDMFRTATNVWSDSCISLCIARTEGEETNMMS